MTLRSLSLTGALLAAQFLGHASAQSISSVTSSNDATVDATVSASVGSVLTINGTAFGTAKGKVFLTDSNNKKYNLKVGKTDWTDTVITATIVKAVAGDLTLNVQPKGAAVPLTSPVTIEAPAIDELQDPQGATITSADANTEFMIVGQFFGTKKGKIKIGGKVAKVTEWADDMIHVVMPKTLANGLWDILLDNKVATDEDNQVTTTASLAKIGKPGLTITIGTGPGAQTINYKFTAGQTGAGYIAFGGSTASFPVLTLSLVVFFDVDNTPVPVDIDSDDNAAMLISFSRTEKGLSKFQPGPFATWLVTPGSPGLIVHVTASGGGQCAGTFTADVPLVVDMIGGQDDPLHIEGEFVFQNP